MSDQEKLLKEKFFALYWGQKVMYPYLDDGASPLVVGRSGSLRAQVHYLSLRNYQDLETVDKYSIRDSLRESSLSIGDITAVVRTVVIGCELHRGLVDLIVPVYNQLVARGVAVPFSGLEVNDMVLKNWVRLKVVPHFPC